MNAFKSARRSGKEGYDYEDLILTHLAVVAATSKNFLDFTITTNAENGTVEDVLLDVLNLDLNRELFAFQIKYKQKPVELFGNHKSVFHPIQYYDTCYRNLQQRFPNCKQITLVLWTYHHFRSPDLIEFSDKDAILTQYNVGGKIYKLNKDQTKLDAVFLENCYIFADQPSLGELDRIVEFDFGPTIFPKSCQNIYNYFRRTEVVCFTRTHIIQILIYLLLRDSMDLSHKIMGSIEHFEAIIEAFTGSCKFLNDQRSANVIISAVSHYINHYFNIPIEINWSEDLPVELLNNIMEDTRINQSAKQKHKWEMLTYKDTIFLLWTIAKIPLVVTYKESNKSQVDLLLKFFSKDILFSNLVFVKYIDT